MVVVQAIPIPKKQPNPPVPIGPQRTRPVPRPDGIPIKVGEPDRRDDMDDTRPGNVPDRDGDGKSGKGVDGGSSVGDVDEVGQVCRRCKCIKCVTNGVGNEATYDCTGCKCFPCEQGSEYYSGYHSGHYYSGDYHHKGDYYHGGDDTTGDDYSGYEYYSGDYSGYEW